jgi:hypothetical protein
VDLQVLSRNRGLIVAGAAIAGVVVYAAVRASDRGVRVRGPVSDQVGDLLWFALLCGLMAYATLEVVKRLTPARGAFNLKLFRDWLAGRISWTPDGETALSELLGAMGLPGHADREAPVPDANTAQQRRDPLPGPKLGSRELRRVFDLPPEQLLAQIATAVDVIASDPAPDRPSALLRALLGRKPQLERIPEPRPRADELPVPAPDRPMYRLSATDSQLLRAALDNLQVTLTQRWRRTVQAAAFAAAGVYGIVLTLAGGISGDGHARYLFAALVVGGPIAWTIRDVTAWFQRLGHPS